MKVFKIVISSLLIFFLLIGNPVVLKVARAQEIPTITPPPVPTITAPPVPTIAVPTVPNITPPPSPTNLPATNNTPAPNSSSSPIPNPTTNTTGSNSSPAISPANGTTSGQQTGGATTNLQTGSATNNTGVHNNVNNNSSLPNTPGNQNSGSTSVTNTVSGANSTNNSSASINTATNTHQNNSAALTNNLSGGTKTGGNILSKNTGGSVNLQTGDANTSGTIISSLNTNTAGVMVSQFDVADDHIGDIVLNFPANCISGCTSDSAKTANSGNGAQTTNNAAVDSTKTDTTFQQNDATVANNLILKSDSGHNIADKNTGGDTTVTTGNANVSGSVLTFANNNISGNVVYGVVNIYGNLRGDIIFPEEAIQNCCNATSSAIAANTGNGAESTNSASLNNTANATTTQNNDAAIENNVRLNATSGDNDVSKNTGGASSVSSGDTSAQANVVNIANSNVEGENMWLVIINRAGQWIGRIIGAPSGSTTAASEGTEIAVGPNGEVIATNSANGTNSTNTADVSSTSDQNIDQTNQAKISNNVDLSSNTGGNIASKNTNGDSTVSTGDAKIIASLVNFVNNNIATTGKLFVTVVNVFGSWIGDFITPGQQKPDPTPTPQTTINPPTNQVHPTSTPSPTPTFQSQQTAYIPLRSDNTPSRPSVLYRTYFANRRPPTNRYILGANANNKLLIADASTNSVNSADIIFGKKQKIKINLAWLVILLPFLGALYISRKALGKYIPLVFSIVFVLWLAIKNRLTP
ncbi:MAG: hypothetical protein UX31_C0003G0023 [Candidatus Nomurabacteria bacterium GW2011_GWA1_46_11]|uniref:Uncharacterized protein n=1 Tax=Candidatus Nomurabacteria bacterium GW2011_GWA1_46_11 TaxID=1618732 RepID=A0A0G1NPV5_9BACT|nr:MAG: hypothetical protein UX31_C0003G0023 [Candidatus Nomurabacteria bacterium GW2011_GWA1_46_11]